jgi:hypothetical protein
LPAGTRQSRTLRQDVKPFDKITTYAITPRGRASQFEYTAVIGKMFFLISVRIFSGGFFLIADPRPESREHPFPYTIVTAHTIRFFDILLNGNGELFLEVLFFWHRHQRSSLNERNKTFPGKACQALRKYFVVTVEQG